MNQVALGVIIAKENLKLAVLDGTAEKPKKIELAEPVIKFSQTDESLGHKIRKAWDALHSVILNNGVTQVGVLKAVGTTYGLPLEIRIKMEGAIELMCATGGLKVATIAPQSLENQRKKFDQYTGGNILSILNGGNKFKSIDAGDAHLCAWCMLLGKGFK